MLEVAGGHIAYDDSGGSGRVVVAIPGMGDTRSEYRILRPRLVAAGYRVITMDVRGQGESSANWADYSAHANARDAIALLEHLHVESAVLVGTSFAAAAPLWAMQDAPDRVAGAVLISPILKDYPLSFAARALLKMGFAGFWRVGFWMWYFDSLFPLSKPKDHAQHRSSVAAMLHEPGRMEALIKMVWMSKSDSTKLIPALTKPAIIIGGSKDSDYADPASELNAIAAQMKIPALVIDGVGHYPQAEAPDQASAAILEFLRSGIVRRTAR